MNKVLSKQEFEQISKVYDEVALRSYSINAKCYSDKKFLEIEKQQIFHKSWQFLCHEENLREPGSYVAADLQGQSIFAARDAQ